MKRFGIRSAVSLLLLLLLRLEGANAQVAQSQDDRILDELRQIRRLLEELVKTTTAKPPQNPVTRLSLEIGEAPVMGDKTAPVTIVEFMDYQCPFCQRFHLATFALLKRDYIDSGKVRFVNRDLPLTEIHPFALRAAQATRCAGDQGQYWPLRDQLQRSTEVLELSNLLDQAAKLNLDSPTFRTCIEKEKYRSAIEADARQAMNWGVNATPSFVIGKSTPSGVDGEIVSGAVPYEALSARLKALLAESSVP